MNTSHEILEEYGTRFEIATRSVAPLYPMNDTSTQLDGLELRETPDGTCLKLKVSPGARRNALGGVHAGMLRVSVTVAPEKGKANRAVLEQLAAALGLPLRALELTAGETSSQKSILVHGLNAAGLRQRLAAHLSSADR